MAKKELKSDDLRIDGGTQMRSLCESTVKEYAEAYQEGIELPPLRAVFDGESYWLYDGFHRWHASRRAGLATVKVDISQGTQRDAVLLACGVNSEHGLRRTNDAKRRSVETLLKDEEWGQWSDAKIAEAAHVTQPFVSKIRSQVITVITSTEKRVGRDGKSYPVKPSKKSAKEQMAEFFGKTETDEVKQDTPKPPKVGSEKSPAKLVDELLRQCIGPLARGIDRIAAINGGKGEQYQIVDGALAVAEAGLREMRKGKQ